MDRNQTDSLLERPDEHEVGDELYCWMPGSDHRECSPGCVAFDTSFKSDQRLSSCKILNTVSTIPKILGSMLKRELEKDVVQARKEMTNAINNLPTPPQVR